MTYKIEAVKQMKNNLERHLSMDLTNAVNSCNHWKDDASELRRCINMHVEEYRSKTNVNRASCKMKTYWPISSEGKFLNSGIIYRDDEETPCFKISITEE